MLCTGGGLKGSVVSMPGAGWDGKGRGVLVEEGTSMALPRSVTSSSQNTAYCWRCEWILSTAFWQLGAGEPRRRRQLKTFLPALRRPSSSGKSAWPGPNLERRDQAVCSFSSSSSALSFARTSQTGPGSPRRLSFAVQRWRQEVGGASDEISQVGCRSFNAGKAGEG